MDNDLGEKYRIYWDHYGTLTPVVPPTRKEPSQEPQPPPKKCCGRKN